ncbi:MAG TPA: hypothetical protein VHN39_08630, partial [Phenylobacterium sp.]|nr:hypothetical protein [Phenylobacterium sp.]
MSNISSGEHRIDEVKSDNPWVTIAGDGVLYSAVITMVGFPSQLRGSWLAAANGMTDGAHLRLMVTRGEKAAAHQDPRNWLGKPT